MHLDARDLQAYYETPLGQLSAKFIRRKLRELWPSTKSMSLLGLGYALPYLRPFRSESGKVIALLPAQQGALHWPPHAPNACALFEESAIPLPDASMDRIIVAHLVENSEALRPLLRQIWRVLSPSGRIIFIVPNRSSLWAQIDTTPFGHGRPFTKTQVHRLLTDAIFTPEQAAAALHMPPFGMHWIVRTGTRWEGWGRNLWPKLAGVHVIEASKQVMGLAAPAGNKARLPFKPVLVGKPVSSKEKSPTQPANCPNTRDRESL